MKNYNDLNNILKKHYYLVSGNSTITIELNGPHALDLVIPILLILGGFLKFAASDFTPISSSTIIFGCAILIVKLMNSSRFSSLLFTTSSLKAEGDCIHVTDTNYETITYQVEEIESLEIIEEVDFTLVLNLNVYNNDEVESISLMKAKSSETHTKDAIENSFDEIIAIIIDCWSSDAGLRELQERTSK